MSANPSHADFTKAPPKGIKVAAPPSVVRATPPITHIDESQTYNDFRDALLRDGYVVVKGAVPRERALHYADEIQSWLEGFGLGYQRDNPSTIREECLPIINPKGLLMAYGAPHESFTWAVRSEPGVIAAFEAIHGTDDLVVSFDSINISLPNRRDLPSNKPWAHQDQDPERPGFRCVQGLVNLLPSGDDDGGLVVMKGGHKISEEYHRTFAGEEQEFRWTNEMYVFKDEGLAWLKERGYEFVKVNAEPGDLVLWDSRAPHFNASPKGSTPRFVIYTCYAPVSAVSQEELIKKKELFETSQGTSHWPQSFQPHIRSYVQPIRNGEPDPHNTWKPRNPPQLSERAFKLTGIPYIAGTA